VKKYFRWLITVLWVLLIWRLTTTPDFRVTDNTILGLILSNGGHFFFFGVLAVLLPLSRSTSLILTSGYGLLIEIVQLNIHGRSFSIFDLALDILGALTFLFLLYKLQSKS